MSRLLPDFSQLFGSAQKSAAASPQQSASLGINIGRSDPKNISQEIEQVTKQIQRTNKKYTDEITKYKEIAKFNQKLTQSYVQNLQVIVDVSKLLEQYANVFYVLREETEKLEKSLGMQFNIDDFRYLERLTADKMMELNKTFMKETTDLKTLYEKYGKADEAKTIADAQTLMETATNESKETFDRVAELDKLGKMTVGGGAKAKKTRGRPRRKPATV